MASSLLEGALAKWIGETRPIRILITCIDASKSNRSLIGYRVMVWVYSIKSCAQTNELIDYTSLQNAWQCVVFDLRPLRSCAINPSVCLSVCVSLSARIFLEPLSVSSPNFVCRSFVAVGRSSSGGIVLRYVLPVLWMTSLLAVMGGMALRRRPDLLLAVSYASDRGAESYVYKWLLCYADETFKLINNFSFHTKVLNAYVYEGLQPQFS